MDKNKFGKVLYCPPYLPIQKFWTFCNKSLLLDKYILNFDRLNNQVRYYQVYHQVKDCSNILADLKLLSSSDQQECRPLRPIKLGVPP